jgi:SAM-dependent methyltransferase
MSKTGVEKDQSTLFRTIPCISCGTPADQHRIILRTRAVHEGSFKGAPLTVAGCPNCGLIFLQPQPTPEALGHFYQHEYYAGKAVPEPQKAVLQEKSVKEPLYSWLIAQLPVKVTGWSILDIGSGYGGWLKCFDQSNRLAAIEQSQQAVKIATEVFGIQVYPVDFMDNHLEGQQFDLLTGLAIIEHFTDPLAALVEMNRLLKKGGYLYLQTPDVHGSVFRRGVEYNFKVVHTFYYSFATLSDLMRRSGFEIIASRRRLPFVENTSLRHPEKFLVGELDIVARKQGDRTLEDARTRPPSGESIDSVLASINAARRRDRVYIWFAALRANRAFNNCLKLLFKMAVKSGFVSRQLPNDKQPGPLNYSMQTGQSILNAKDTKADSAN